MTKTLLARNIVTRADWESVTHIRTFYHSHLPRTLEETIEGAQLYPASSNVRRVLYACDGKDVAHFVSLDAYWMQAKGRRELQGHALTPEDYAAAFDLEATIAAESGADKLSTWCSTDKPKELDHILRRGFVETQRNPESALFTDEFDPTQWASAIDHVHGRFEIVSYAQYAEREPQSWKHDLWRTEMDIMADVPLPEPFKEASFEDFSKELDFPFNDQTMLFLALDSGRPVGLSQILPNHANPELARTGLTGVLRDYRRDGIATALKVSAITKCKERGIKSIWTDNEEANPMFQINVKLGFRTQFEWVCLERSLAGD
ncbi:MAG: GNAT family N-acetyltransferase [Armatimonadetes bacterium]|nr:GNAT family N-acetyltransferase [Armatimonadota bacterium]